MHANPLEAMQHVPLGVGEGTSPGAEMAGLESACCGVPRALGVALGQPTRPQRRESNPKGQRYNLASWAKANEEEPREPEMEEE